MITDKLLTFAESAGMDSASAVIDLGAGGTEVARTMNLVVQVEGTSISPSSATVSCKLIMGDAPESLAEVQSWPAVEVGTHGVRVVDFEKLPLHTKRYLKVELTKSNTITGATWSAYLTDSCEAYKED